MWNVHVCACMSYTCRQKETNMHLHKQFLSPICNMLSSPRQYQVGNLFFWPLKVYLIFSKAYFLAILLWIGENQFVIGIWSGSSKTSLIRPDACKQLWLVSEPLGDVTHNPNIVFQIINEMIHIENILEFPAWIRKDLLKSTQEVSRYQLKQIKFLYNFIFFVVIRISSQEVIPSKNMQLATDITGQWCMTKKIHW